MSKKIQIYLISGIRIVMIVVVFVFAILLQMGDKNSTTDIATVQQAIISGVNIDSVSQSSNRMIKKYYGLNVNDYEGVIHYAPLTNMDAEEIFVVKLKDQSQAEAVVAAINKRLETQKASFEGYGIEQFDLLERHILDVKGNYILFVVHPDASRIDQAFRNSL